MNSLQYEELCRVFLAEKLGIPVDQVKSILMPSPTFPGLPELKHQIDLYWETGDELALYLNVANAKWRGEIKVEQGEVLLLQQVKMETRAHKAMMITNTDFTSGARSAAQHHGIALHIVQPTFDYSALDARRRDVMQSQMATRSSETKTPLYAHEIVYRAFDLQTQPESSSASQSSKVATINRIVEQPGTVQKIAPASDRSLQSGTTSAPSMVRRVITPRDRGRGGKPR